jgi:hypothetical protein
LTQTLTRTLTPTRTLPLATLRRRIGVGPARCVYRDLDVFCSLAMALGAPLLQVASKIAASLVSLPGWLCCV